MSNKHSFNGFGLFVCMIIVSGLGLSYTPQSHAVESLFETPTLPQRKPPVPGVSSIETIAAAIPESALYEPQKRIRNIPIPSMR